jgi:hypothetical protein
MSNIAKTPSPSNNSNKENSSSDSLPKETVNVDPGTIVGIICLIIVAGLLGYAGYHYIKGLIKSELKVDSSYEETELNLSDESQGGMFNIGE